MGPHVVVVGDPSVSQVSHRQCGQRCRDVSLRMCVMPLDSGVSEGVLPPGPWCGKWFEGQFFPSLVSIAACNPLCVSDPVSCARRSPGSHSRLSFSVSLQRDVQTRVCHSCGDDRFWSYRCNHPSQQCCSHGFVLCSLRLTCIEPPSKTARPCSSSPTRSVVCHIVCYLAPLDFAQRLVDDDIFSSCACCSLRAVRPQRPADRLFVPVSCHLHSALLDRCCSWPAQARVRGRPCPAMAERAPVSLSKTNGKASAEVHWLKAVWNERLSRR